MFSYEILLKIPPPSAYPSLQAYSQSLAVKGKDRILPGFFYPKQ
jgi:hypothetical protein